MSQSTETVAFRTQIKVAVSNFLQKYRGLLVGLVVGGIVVIVGLALWTQIDGATKTSYAAKIEKSQADYVTWLAESDATKKDERAKSLEAELEDVQKNAPVGYGLAKAWFIQANYLATQKKWTEAANAYHTVFERDAASYLAPIALVNAAVAAEEAGDVAGALATYAEFDKVFSTDRVLAPQVFFTEGRLLESQQKKDEAVAAYKKLLDKYPESGWTKLGRDRILLLSPE